MHHALHLRGIGSKNMLDRLKCRNIIGRCPRHIGIVNSVSHICHITRKWYIHHCLLCKPHKPNPISRRHGLQHGFRPHLRALPHPIISHTQRHIHRNHMISRLRRRRLSIQHHLLERPCKRKRQSDQHRHSQQHQHNVLNAPALDHLALDIGHKHQTAKPHGLAFWTANAMHKIGNANQRNTQGKKWSQQPHHAPPCDRLLGAISPSLRRCKNRCNAISRGSEHANSSISISADKHASLIASKCRLRFSK